MIHHVFFISSLQLPCCIIVRFGIALANGGQTDETLEFGEEEV